MINIYTLGMAGTLIVMCFLNGIKNVKSRKKIALWLFIMFWGSLMAFRALSVGTDTYNYAVNIFPRFATQPLVNLSDFYKMPIYAIYNKIIGVINTNPHTIIIFTSFIYTIGVTVFLYYNSDNFYMSCFYFISIAYYFFAMNTARQSLAIMLVLWAYHFMARKMYFPSVLMLILAVGIHSTAIVGILIVILPLINMTHKKSLIIIVATFVSMLMVDTIFNLFVRFFPSYLGYLELDNSVYATSDGKRIYLALILLVVFVICYFWKQKKKIVFKNESEFWVLFTLSMISIEFMTILRNNYITARVEYYFSYFFMLFLPFCIERFFNKESKYIAYGGTIVVFIVLFYIRIQPFLPYVFWE